VITAEYPSITLGSWMAEEVPQSLDLQVLQMIKGALKSREVWNAERPDGVPPYSDD